jgi:A nuclease family of the HNH/ENDO VII superfamily with conserved AHH/Domain of unknown function (DUF4157)
MHSKSRTVNKRKLAVLNDSQEETMPDRAARLEKTTAATPKAQKPEPAPQAEVRALGGVLDHASGVGMRPALSKPSEVLAMHPILGNRIVMRLMAARRAISGSGAGPLKEESVQRRMEGLRDPSDQEIHSAAAEGVRTPATRLPYLDRIQASFGHHSVRHVKAHLGTEAAQASQAISALAFASGEHVVFGATPDLRTVAHEAAHIVQQQAGVQLTGGIGREGDAYERHADAVADAVAAGRSAETLLDPFAALHMAEEKLGEFFPSSTSLRTSPIQGIATRTISNQLEIRPFVQMVHGSFDPANYVGVSHQVDPINRLLALLRNTGNSGLLRLELQDAGVPDAAPGDPDNQAHHIVEVNDPNAQRSRTLLQMAGIDINSSINGVFLPVVQSDDSGDATVHRGSHVAEYAQAVENTLINAINNDPYFANNGVTATQLLQHYLNVGPLPALHRQALRDALIVALANIRELLLTQHVPINRGKNVDPDYDPNEDKGGKGGEKKISTHFRGANLY